MRVSEARLHRLRLISWAFVIVGLPISITLQLWLSRLSVGVASGDQPGGCLQVRLLDPGGEPAVGHTVELQLLPVGGPPRSFGTSTVNGEGRTAFAAPPLLGKYRLLAGGGGYRRVGRECSFLDAEGNEVEQAETLLELRQGVQIALSFTRKGGGRPAGGQVWLDGSTLDGPLLGLLGTPIELTQDFEGGECLLEGLPPLEGTVRVRFGTGAELEFQVRAESGRVELGYEL